MNEQMETEGPSPYDTRLDAAAAALRMEGESAMSVKDQLRQAINGMSPEEYDNFLSEAVRNMSPDVLRKFNVDLTDELRQSERKIHRDVADQIADEVRQDRGTTGIR